MGGGAAKGAAGEGVAKCSACGVQAMLPEEGSGLAPNTKPGPGACGREMEEGGSEESCGRKKGAGVSWTAGDVHASWNAMRLAGSLGRMDIARHDCFLITSNSSGSQGLKQMKGRILKTNSIQQAVYLETWP